VRDDFGNLACFDAIVERPVEIRRQLRRLIARDQDRHGNEAAIARRWPGAFPEIAKKDALRVPLERRRDHPNIIKRAHCRESIRFCPFHHSVFLLADLFHPINVLTFERLLNGDMRQLVGRGSAVPMFHAWWRPYDVTLLDLLLYTALLLNPAGARRDDQDLSERMGMPCGARTRFERDTAAGHPRRRVYGEESFDPHMLVKFASGPFLDARSPLGVMVIFCGLLLCAATDAFEAGVVLSRVA
jgi:hypothetical protein